MMKKRKHHAYIIRWHDSSALPGWHMIGDNRHSEVAVINSVGWMVRSDPKTVTITTSISESGRVMDALAIPRSCIVKMVKLPRHIEDNSY